MKYIAALTISVVHFASFGQGTGDTLLVNQLYQQSRRYWTVKPDSAMALLTRSEELAKKAGYAKGVAYALYGEGVNTQNLYEQFRLFTRSLEIFERIHDRFGEGLNLVKIGEVYRDIGQPDKAFEYYLRALKVKKELDDNGGTALTLIDIGKYNQSHGKPAEALENFREALVYRRRENTPRGIAYAQFNIGSALLSLGKPAEGLAELDSALMNFSHTTDDVGRINVLAKRADAYSQLNRPELAIATYREIVAFPSKYRTHPMVLEARKRLANHFRATGNVKESLDLLYNYVEAKDSLASVDQRVATQRAANEYEFKLMQQKELQAQILRDAKVNRRNLLEYLVIATVVVLFFVILFAGRSRLSGRVAQGTVFIALLLFFEFLLVLTDSPVENLTGGEPIFKLLANVLLALFVLPVHGWLEAYVQRKVGIARSGA